MSASTPSRLNSHYLLISLSVVAFLLYFVLSLPEGINAALSYSLVSARSGVGISAYAYAYGTTVPATTVAPPPPTPDAPTPSICVWCDQGNYIQEPPYYYDPCANTSTNVSLTYYNSTYLPPDANWSITLSERGNEQIPLSIKNFDPRWPGVDVYVYIKKGNQSRIPVSVIGLGSNSQPIKTLASNVTQNVTLQMLLDAYTGGDFYLDFGVVSCEKLVYDPPILFSPFARDRSVGTLGDVEGVS